MNCFLDPPDSTRNAPVTGIDSWERRAACWSYLAALFATIGSVAAASGGMGICLLGGPLVSLVVWQHYRHQSEFVEAHAREAFGVLFSTFLFAGLSLVLGMLAVLVLPVVALYGAGCLAWGAWHARLGWSYRAPVCFRLSRS